jgi:hypothetical protein
LFERNALAKFLRFSSCALISSIALCCDWSLITRFCRANLPLDSSVMRLSISFADSDCGGVRCAALADVANVEQKLPRRPGTDGQRLR